LADPICRGWRVEAIVSPSRSPSELSIHPVKTRTFNLQRPSIARSGSVTLVRGRSKGRRGALVCPIRDLFLWKIEDHVGLRLLTQSQMGDENGVDRTKSHVLIVCVFYGRTFPLRGRYRGEEYEHEE